MEEVFNHVLRKIRDAEITTEPFLHIVIPDIFPTAFYDRLLATIPRPEQFSNALYPGTGFGSAKRSERKASGLAFPEMHTLPLLSELQQFLRGDAFCRALLDKFSQPGGIPSEKYRYFANGNHEFTSVFDLHIDRRGYEILPHADIASKIVTFQFYLPSDDSLKEFGTLFCRPKSSEPPKRNAALIGIGSLMNRLNKLCRHRPGRVWEWIERTRFGTEVGYGNSGGWYPWRFFDIVAMAPALPNHFMAFAPNDKSFHAVRMNIPESSKGRTVIRGFLRSGSNASNYIHIRQRPEHTPARS